jgi:hypothetical protein
MSLAQANIRDVTGLRICWGQARRLVQSSSRPDLGDFVHRGSGISYWFGCISFDFLQISQGRARGFLDEEEHRAFPNTFSEFTLLIHVDSPSWKAYVFTGTLFCICNSQERLDLVLQEVPGGSCTFRKVRHVHSRFLGFSFSLYWSNAPPLFSSLGFSVPRVMLRWLSVAC